MSGPTYRGNSTPAGIARERETSTDRAPPDPMGVCGRVHRPSYPPGACARLTASGSFSTSRRRFAARPLIPFPGHGRSDHDSPASGRDRARRVRFRGRGTGQSRGGPGYGSRRRLARPACWTRTRRIPRKSRPSVLWHDPPSDSGCREDLYRSRVTFPLVLSLSRHVTVAPPTGRGGQSTCREKRLNLPKVCRQCSSRVQNTLGRGSAFGWAPTH